MSETSSKIARSLPVIPFILGIVFAVVIAGIAGYVVVLMGGTPANADGRPSALERWAAKRSLHATVFREMTKAPPPIVLDDANLLAGMKVYGDNCIVCHGNAQGTTTNIARGLYIRAPRFGARPIRRDPDGEIYWKVDHGIRWTAMPAFGETLTTTQMWQVTVFLKQMSHLPPSVADAWKTLRISAPTAGASERRSDQTRGHTSTGA